MTFSPRQQQLVSDSFALIREEAIPVTLLFYGRLFDLDPSTRRMFQPDLQTQSKKLVDMLEVIVSSLSQFDRIRPRLGQLGASHAELGVQPAHYETLTSAWLWALSMGLERQFTPETKAAWKVVLEAVSEVMIRGAVQK
ncbi:MAG: hemin receptor [Bryobacteraceae bacterium]|nr:hemin receptor [Bryobacteraceae bacterium]